MQTFFLHKILMLQGELTDEIYLEHFYFLYTLQGFLVTKGSAQKMLSFFNEYTKEVKEQLLILYYLYDEKLDFLCYFKTARENIEELFALYEKQNIEKKDFLKDLYQLKRYGLERIQKHITTFDKRSYEKKEQEKIGLELTHPSTYLEFFYVMNQILASILFRKKPLSLIKFILKQPKNVFLILGCIHKFLYELLQSVYPEKQDAVIYHLEDFTYLHAIITDFFPYAKDTIQKEQVNLIKKLLSYYQEEDFVKIIEPHPGKILMFQKKEETHELQANPS